MKTQLSLLLASASPRRRQILARLELPYTVGTAPGDEDAAQALFQGPPQSLAQWTAAHKALMMFTRTETSNHIVITADTTVILDGRVLGKPLDAPHAREMLNALRGHWHQVITGVVVSALIDGHLEVRGASCTTNVLMRDYTDAEMEEYIASGDPMDKAGAYAIQNAQFQPVERIDGCYYNVVGLPLCTLIELLDSFGVQPPTSARQDNSCPWSEECHVGESNNHPQ